MKQSAVWFRLSRYVPNSRPIGLVLPGVRLNHGLNPAPAPASTERPSCFFSTPVDENDLIGLAKGVGPDLLKIAPAALAAAPAALPLLAGALGVPGEALYLAALGSFGAGELGVCILGVRAAGPSDRQMVQRCASGGGGYAAVYLGCERQGHPIGKMVKTLRFGRGGGCRSHGSSRRPASSASAEHVVGLSSRTPALDLVDARVLARNPPVFFRGRGLARGFGSVLRGMPPP